MWLGSSHLLIVRILFVAQASAKIDSVLPLFLDGTYLCALHVVEKQGDVLITTTLLRRIHASNDGCAKIQSRVRGVIVSIIYGSLQERQECRPRWAMWYRTYDHGDISIHVMCDTRTIVLSPQIRSTVVPSCSSRRATPRAVAQSFLYGACCCSLL